MNGKRGKPVSLAAWESVSDDVLAVLLSEEAATDASKHFDMALEEGLALDHFPPGERRHLMSAILELREQKRRLTWNAIESVAVGVTEKQYALLVALADPTRMGAVFRDNARLLIEYGVTLSMAEGLKTAREALLAGGDRDQVVDQVVDQVTRQGVVRIVGETADQSAQNLRALMDGAPLPLVSTGMAWLDETVGGFGENELWYIAGPYKSSKTRLAYNMALHSARRGVSTAILSLENLQREIAAQFVAMLAVEWLLAQGKVPYDRSAPVYWIGPKALLRVRAGYKQWTALKAQAVDHGLEMYSKLGKFLRVYDRSEEHGALKDMASIKRVVQRDKRLYNGRLYFVDHQGLVDGTGSTYEQTSATSKAFQGLSRAYPTAPITLVVLAQKNEQNILSDAEGYSPGVKGGGDSAANSDVTLTTKPVPVADKPGEFHNDRSSVRIALARWGAAGHKELVGFHPDSGLWMSLEVPAAKPAPATEPEEIDIPF